VLLRQRAVAVFRGPDPSTGSYREQVTAAGEATVTASGFTGPTIMVDSLFG